MLVRRLLWMGVLCQMGLSAHAQCLTGFAEPAVRSGPVRLMAQVDTDALLPASPRLAGGANTGPAPAGVSPGAAILGALLGHLVINRINTAQQESAAKRQLWVSSALERADAAGHLREGLHKILKDGGFAQVNLDKDADPLDMEQPGLLQRISEPYTMTAHVQYGWTGGDDRIAWARLKLKLWQKGGFRPVSCREYVYVGADSVAKEEGASDAMLIEQMVSESLGELSSMVGLDARQSFLDAAAKEAAKARPVTMLAVKLPAVAAEPAVKDAAMTPVEERPLRWVASHQLDQGERWWSVPKQLADLGATVMPIKTGP